MGVAFDMSEDGTFVGEFRHSREDNSGWMKEMTKSSGYIQTQQYNMNGSSNAANDVGQLTAFANIGKDAVAIAGIITSIDDEKTQEIALERNIARAFGSDVAQMGEFITEVMQSLGAASQLSQAQKDQLFDMVSEIVTLKNLMNAGSTPEGQARLEAMIAETATKIAETLLDGMNNQSFSGAIVKFVHGLLSDVSQKYDIPTLNDTMTKIEGRMHPENYLATSTAEIIAQLVEILETQGLSEDAQAEIESLIETMENAIEKGEPIPRDIMQALDSLSENYPEISLKSEFTKSIEILKDANIVVKSDTLGLSIVQAQAFEAAIETLETPSNDTTKSKLDIDILHAEHPALSSVIATMIPNSSPPIMPERSKIISLKNEVSPDIQPSNPETSKIQPEKPVDPDPVNPNPKDPDPKDPDPKDPDPKDPDPKDPDPKDPDTDKLESKSHEHGPNCGCGDAFNKAQNPNSTLEQLKKDMREILQQAGSEPVSNKELQDTLIKKMRDMTESQKAALTLEVAKDHFKGDVKAAKSHLQGVQDNLKIDEAQKKGKEAELQAKNASYKEQQSNGSGGTGSPKDDFGGANQPTRPSRPSRPPKPNVQTYDI